MLQKILVQFTIEVVTGLHIGGSDAFSAIGAVQNPIIRNPADYQPVLPGSSLKGKIRALLEKADNENNATIQRLFGKQEPPIVLSRLQFADAFVSNAAEYKEIGLVEVKFENTIDRVSATAMPRQLERVVPGVQFQENLIYNVDNEIEKVEDLQTLARGLKLLQLDYLGGHGTRGSGRVKIIDVKLYQFSDNERVEITEKELKEPFTAVENFMEKLSNPL